MNDAVEFQPVTVKKKLSVSIDKSSVCRADKRFSIVKIVSFLSCRSNHVVPQCFGHVLMGNQ